MLEIILVRHGETDSNKRNTFCGWTDVPLNDAGRSQAENAAQKLASSIPDAIYASPLSRTLETAEILNRNYRHMIQMNEDLKERNCGIWEDLTYADICSRFPEERLEWEKDPSNYCIDGGESAVQVYDRVNAAISLLREKHKTGRILIVTHLGCIQAALAGLLGLGTEGVWRFRVDNCGITRVKVNDEGYAYLTGLNM